MALVLLCDVKSLDRWPGLSLHLVASATVYFRMNPLPIFLRGTPAPPEERRWPNNQVSLIVLLAPDDFGGRTLVADCRTRIILPPRLISFGGLGSLSSIFDFLLTTPFSVDEGGVGGRATGSVASRSSGSRSGSLVFFCCFEASGWRRCFKASA